MVAPAQCLPRWGTARTDSRATHGTVAVQIAEALGLELMPWQQHVLDVALEVDEDTGRLAYRHVVLSVPRQSGKTTLMLVLMTLRCVAFGDRQQVVYTAQDRNSAREKWENEYLEALAGSQFADGRDFWVRKSNGSESVRWANGSRQTISATLSSSGHGRTLDLVLIDEAFEHQDSAAIDGSFGPPMLARPEPQLWTVSTAGTWKSRYLNEKRDAGRAAVERGETSGLAYFEWSADPEADLWDPDAWWSCIPSLGHTVSEDAVRGLIGAMTPRAARRAFLNLTTEADEDDNDGMDIEAWSRQVDGRSKIAEPAPVLALDGSPDRRYGSIGVAGWRADGDIHAELVETRLGIDWMVPRAVELVKRHQAAGVAVDPTSAAGSCIPSLEAAGVEVFKMPARAHAHAAGTIYDKTVDGRLWHRGQGEVQAAVEAAKRRPLGDAWAWDRRSDDDNLTPFVAMTLAVGQLLALPEQVDETSIYDELEGFGEW